jgi:DNA (cytosine-5)-methyltransferase 1
MATVKFYLDKVRKNGLAPIDLTIHCSGEKIKVSNIEQVKVNDFDVEGQQVLATDEEAAQKNSFLNYMKERAEYHLGKLDKKKYTNKELKALLQDYVTAYRSDTQTFLVKEQLAIFGKHYNFIDLFAGAGGFSEGFLQAEVNNKFFDFVLASDINENCDLTHEVRYNHQLGLDSKFLRQDITEPDFLDNLLNKLEGKTIDVVCGGPPCQSFSLAGKRKKYDKKDDLFSHYLEVIKVLQPKYFVMENVKGILTKEKGKIKDLILEEINSIVDIKEIPKLTEFIKELKVTNKRDEFLLDCLAKRVEIERAHKRNLESAKKEYIKSVESKFRKLTPKIADYKTSKTDERINTIRHGFNLLLRNKELEKLKRDIIKEKDQSYLDGDYYVDDFNIFISSLDSNEIINKIELAFERISIPKPYLNEVNNILKALKIYTYSFEETILYVKNFCNQDKEEELNKIIDSIRLYKIEKPYVANASNYGVPQNRERVLFIGCRKDQKMISEIPPTVNPEEKITVLEALHDLDFIDNNERASNYEPVDVLAKFNGTGREMKKLIRKRKVDGNLSKNGHTYAEWSRKGRLNGRFNMQPPIYVKSFEDLEIGFKKFDKLHNHQTSNQKEEVLKRLEIIRQSGDYKEAKCELEACGLDTNKRNYNVLKPDSQSSTIMTIADDYIHYNSPRALTVREMARLQSFDDSFVFQGKRSTGGNRRKDEIPQFTLVGNAVPPLLARAVGMKILESIK